MSLDGVYDPNNIFAKILRGEAPCHRLYEDEVALAFLDVFPQAEGHALVVPKHPARNLFELPPALLGPWMERVQRVAGAVRTALQPDGVIITQFNGAPAGQTVFHLHMHIIPRWTGVELKRHGGAMADPEALRALAQRICAALPAD
jgi:histidine triad (HIT) family protein